MELTEIVILSEAKDLLFVYAATNDSDNYYYVYILSNRSRTLYIGVTSALISRVQKHRDGLLDGFTKRYRIYRLVYFETSMYVNNAIAREKELKGWLRGKKVALIEAANPTWADLYLGLIGESGEKQILPLRLRSGSG